MLSNEFSDKEKILLENKRNSDLERIEAEEKIMAKGLDQSNEDGDIQFKPENGNLRDFQENNEEEGKLFFTPKTNGIKSFDSDSK